VGFPETPYCWSLPEIDAPCGSQRDYRKIVADARGNPMRRVILESIARVALHLLAVLAASTAQAAIIGADDSVPVASLAPNDPIRQAAQPVGLLRAVGRAALSKSALPQSFRIATS
jgi:hypothetical protein